MPLLKVEANKLTLPSLQLGVVQTIITRGARELLADLPFKSFEGESYAFNREKTLPTDNSARDPYGSSLPGGVGTRQRVAVESGMLARNVDTAKIDIIGKSNLNNQRNNDILLASKKLAGDLVAQFLHGIHDDSGTYTDYNLKGLEYWLKFYEADFNEQKIFGTTNGLVTGTKSALSLRMVDDLLSRHFGGDFTAIYSDRATQVTFMNLYNLAGGNTGAMFMDANFGKGERVFSYRGKPWYVLDEAGAPKNSITGDIATSAVGGVTVGASPFTTITVSDIADPFFLGFSDIDVGRSITISGAAAAAADLTTTIVSVTNYRQVVIADAADSAVTGKALRMAKANVIYAVRYDEEDGVTALFHENMTAPADAGEYFGPIAGFDFTDLGDHQDAPVKRARIDWYGNMVQHSPYAVARLSHFIG